MSKPYLSNQTKRQVQDRARNFCEYCLANGNYSFHPFAVDHIIPISLGGMSSLDNLALACQHCNNCKYNKQRGWDPVNQNEAALFHPRIEKWAEHFIWNEDYSMIIGITASGRSTVYSLKMNRLEAINLRKALYQYGVHPPDFI